MAVPSVEEEALRDLVRAREDLRGDLMRARHRLAKLLLRHEVRFDGPQANWTQAHLGWLAGVRLAQPASQRALEDYRGAVSALMIRREQLEAEIARALPESPWAQTARRLMCLRGIDTLTAAGLCAEIGDFDRFRHPAQVMSYLGVVPSEHSSGERRRRGPITKSGSQHARRLLVEAAWHYRRPPRVAGSLARRQTRRRAARSWRCHGRRSGGCITSGSGWSSATSAARSSPSPPRASSPASAGRSRPPTDPGRQHTLVERGGGRRALRARASVTHLWAADPRGR